MSGEETPVAVYILDGWVDCLFVIDIFLSFSLAYRSPETGGEIPNLMVGLRWMRAIQYAENA